jgi:nucleotide-binding universal stress UspA family protein
MFARALFPTDFSDYACSVLACLPELKAAGLREVVLLHVIRSSDVPLAETVNLDSMQRVRWGAEEHLNLARLALEGQGLRVHTRIEYGSAPTEIVRVGEEERASLIVIGAQGWTAAKELLMGSVTYKLLRLATLPVLIQRFDVVKELGRVTCRRVCGEIFTRVLHPTDFSKCADEAFQIVKRLRSAGTKHVTLLHVQDDRVMTHRPPEQIAEFDREDKTRLARLERALVLYGLEVNCIVRRGIPFQETLRVADEEDAGLIVLGSCGRSAIREALTGSTFENVARLSRKPVLVIHGNPEEMAARISA